MYQGYTNYETWAVSLWLNNEYGDWSHWDNRAKSLLEDHEGDKEEASSDLAEEIKESVTESNPLSDAASVYSDIMTAALQSVDWLEVAECFTDDLEYEEEED